MHWYIYPAYFFGGAVFANALPHLVNGISGSAFQTPFANPPGEGLSSPTVNVLWGFFQSPDRVATRFRVASFDLRNVQHALILGAGMLIMSVLMARAFGRFHGGR